MPKQKNLSPLELEYLIKYKDNKDRESLQELSVNMGYPVEVLESYLEKLGGIKVEEQPVEGELTPEQIMVRKSFASGKGAVMMTEGTSGLIEEMQGNPSFNHPTGKPTARQKNSKTESSIFRGNKKLGAEGNPYAERRN